MTHICSLSQVVVLLTNGDQAESGNNPADASAMLRQIGATVLAVGVGEDVSVSELNAIATDADYAFNPASFKDLADRADDIVSKICEGKRIRLSVKRGYSVRIYNGNRTEWSPIRSVIIRVITKLDDCEAGVQFVITSMITDRHRATRSSITN